MISIVALISPYKVSRDSTRELIGNGRFIEVYVRASLETCEVRYPKGHYAKARRGEINNMIGIQDPYEIPTSDITVDTEGTNPEESERQLTENLEKLGMAKL